MRKHFSVSLKEQDTKLLIENIDECSETKRMKLRHSILLPNTIRAVFCGPSNSGKTNALISLIKSENEYIFRIYTYIQNHLINLSIDI